MRLVVEIPDDLHAEFKTACAIARTTQSHLVRGWIESYVSDRPVDAARGRARAIGLSKKAQAQGRSRK